MKISYIGGIIQRIVGKKEEEIEFPEERTVKELIHSLVDKYGDQLRYQIMNVDGSLRRLVRILLDGDDVNQIGGLDASLRGKREVSLVVAIPLIAGGLEGGGHEKQGEKIKSYKTFIIKRNPKPWHGSACRWVFLLLLVCLCLGRSRVLAQQGEEKAMKLQIKSTAFEEGGTIPEKYTCDGEDVSPPLSWTSPPKGTKGLVLICDDPDAPMGTWVHWVLFGLSPDTSALPEGVPAQKVIPGGAKQGINDFHKIGYGGPCPPKGPAHRYFFKLYALDSELDLSAGATKEEVLKAMEEHILAEGQLVSRYSR